MELCVNINKHELDLAAVLEILRNKWDIPLRNILKIIL